MVCWSLRSSVAIYFWVVDVVSWGWEVLLKLVMVGGDGEVAVVICNWLVMGLWGRGVRCGVGMGRWVWGGGGIVVLG